MSYASKAEFGADVRRARRGDKAAQERLRKYADDPRMRREAVKRARPRRTSTQTSGSPQLQIPPRGRFIRSAVLEAIRLLGINGPVMIRWENADNMAAPKPGYRMNGEHTFTPEGTHIIKLLPGRSAEATSRTLRHELTHAMQAERCGTRAKWARAKLNDASGIESEADEVARVLGHLDLVK